MKKNILAGIGVIIVLLGMYMFLPQNTDSLRSGAESNAERMSGEDTFPAMIEVVRGDLELSPTTILSLQAVDGNYYDFGANDPEGGGVEILAYRNTNGSFERVWEGQDYPDCFSIEQREVYFYEPEERIYTVPVSLAPQCFKTEVKNRTRLIDRFTSWMK